ncbi:sugar ABC transporter substrate-binding protein [Arcanobacterium phocisimile]|uniref:Sugar ABC transporter substrate-binding protein n=1 Tax=Arcanobacterium phocisimile TaxID=1302235 RepID=A0ABX7IH95_9ACTO|nr:sugar ABC transporter substrate-binding protein [Arcanobacterium phocisimile]QRV02327.1 sugar ABC transporter substrate-binding protein [Arcanobacterium phocisimile]
MKIRSASIGFLAATTLLLSACTGGGVSNESTDNAGEGNATGEITFQTWSLKNDKFTPYFEKLVADFEKANPGAKIKWIDQPGDGYEDKVLQQAESGELPDVINLPPEYAYALASVDQLMDLKKESKIIDEYVPGGVEAYTFDGVEGSFGFPWYLGTELNYWNTELLEKAGVSQAPSTYKELWAVAEKLGQDGIQTISDLPSPKGLQIMVSDAGGKLDIIKDGKFAFNTPEAEEIVNTYIDLYKKGAISPEALQNAGTANANVNNFNKGTAAWTTAGPNYIDKDVAVNAPTLLPNMQVTAGFGNPPLFVQGISVAKNSKNPELALKFAEFVTNTENQIEFVKLAVGFFPGTVAANADPSTFAIEAEHEQQKVATDLAAKQMDKAKMTGDPKFTTEMETFAKQQIALAVKGEITAKEALDKSVEHAQQAIEK